MEPVYLLMINSLDLLNKMKRVIWLVMLLVSVSVLAQPVFLNPGNNAIMNVTEDVNFKYNISITEVAVNFPVTFEDTADDDAQFYCFNKSKINNTLLGINFTPSNSYVGFYTFSLIAKNVLQEGTVLTINFNVSNTNDPPVIIDFTPPGYIEVSENASLTFTVLIHDDDLQNPTGDNLSFIWFVDGVQSAKLPYTKYNTTASNATYNPLIEDFDAGLHNITVIINDSAGVSVNQTLEIGVNNVNRPPVFNITINDINWTEDTDLNNNISLMDYFFDKDVLYNSSGNDWCDLDTGDCLTFGYELTNGTDNITISFDSGGNVTFSPNTHFFGNVTVHFYVDDTFFGGRAYSNNVTLMVLPINDPPYLDPIADQITYALSTFTYQANAVDPEDDSFQYFISSPTLSISIDNETGQITYYSTQADADNHTINVSTSDGMDNHSVEFNLEIRNNSRPNITAFSDISVQQFSSFNFTANATDGDGDILNFWTNFSLINPGTRNNDSSWNFSVYTTLQSYVGNHSVRLYVNDTKNSITDFNFTIEIFDFPMPPVITPVSVENNQIKVNTNFSILVPAYDEDGDIDVFGDNDTEFNIVTQAAGTNGIGNISWEPSVIGTYYFNISVNDSLGQNDSFRLTLDVTANRAPYFDNITNITCDENQLCTADFDASDPDWQDRPYLIYGDNTTKFDIDSSTGVISFTPTLVEIYTVEISVYDGAINYSEIIVVNVSKYNDPPIFLWNLSNMTEWQNIIEGSQSEFNISAYDEENDTITFNVTYINFTSLNGSTTTTNISLFDFSSVVYYPHNNSAGLINFTPSSSEVGYYWVTISVSDGNSITSETFDFTVQNINNPPDVMWNLSYLYRTIWMENRTNTYTYINQSVENSVIRINASATDPDFEGVSYFWYRIDGSLLTLISSGPKTINFTLPYDTSPGFTLLLSVRDDSLATTNITWYLNVSNVNRNVTFGLKNYYFNSSQGTFDNTEVVNDNLYLDRPGVFYDENGSFISEALDFKVISYNLPSIDYQLLNITNLDGNLTYNVTYYTATSNVNFIPSPTTIWDQTTVLGNWFNVTSTNNRYFAFWVDIQSDTLTSPILDQFDIHFDIDDLDVSVSSQTKAWFDLDHFFDDPDVDDTMTYGINVTAGDILINVSIITGNFVTVLFRAEGVAQLFFTASDPYGSVAQSNLVTVTISQEQEEEQIETGGGSSGGSSVMIQRKYRERTVNEPIALDIIHPENITFSSNKTIQIPIKLKNSEDFDFEGLSIYANVDRPGLDLWLDRDEIELLEKGQEEDLMLTINVSDIYDSYSVFVTVNVTEPPYEDSAKIRISSLKRLRESEEEQQLKLAFVQDLLQRNRECAELSEYIKRAKRHLEEGDVERGIQLLDQFIEDCKILIKTETPDLQLPDDFTGNFLKTITSTRENLITAIVIGALIIVAILFVIFLMYKKI